MAEKVWVVIDGWENDMVAGYHGERLECICDTLDSACCYIRNRLGILVNEHANRYHDVPRFKECYSTFADYWHDCGYDFDPEVLPSNNELSAHDRFYYNHDMCDCYFAISEREVDHYV